MDTMWRRSRQDIFERAAQKMTKISSGVKPGHLEEGRGPKMAKFHYGVKPDIFKYAQFRFRVQGEGGDQLLERGGTVGSDPGDSRV